MLAVRISQGPVRISGYLKTPPGYLKTPSGYLKTPSGYLRIPQDIPDRILRIYRHWEDFSQDVKGFVQHKLKQLTPPPPPPKKREGEGGCFNISL